MGAAVKGGAGGHPGGKRRSRPKQRVVGRDGRHMESPLDRANGREVNWPQASPVFNSARRIGAGLMFVYFIAEIDDGPIKIGVAKDPVQRLRGMQTGNPRRLRIEYILIGNRETEQLLHEIWREYAIPAPGRKVDSGPGTEWFRPEIRSDLFPVLATAASWQVAYVASTEDEVLDYWSFDAIIRHAHDSHDVALRARDETGLLAAVAGTVVRRRSRILPQFDT